MTEEGQWQVGSMAEGCRCNPSSFGTCLQCGEKSFNCCTVISASLLAVSCALAPHSPGRSR